MPISLDDKLRSMSEAARRLPARPHASTLWRWYARGVRGVRLETVLIAGRRYTTDDALEKFIAATTAAADGERPAPRTPKQRERAIAQAEKEVLES